MLRYVVIVFVNTTGPQIHMARMYQTLQCWVRMLRYTSWFQKIREDHILICIHKQNSLALCLLNNHPLFNHSKETSRMKVLSQSRWSLRNPQKSLTDFIISLGIPVFKKNKLWAGNSISFVHIWYSGETANHCKGCWKNSNSWRTQGTLLLLCIAASGGCAAALNSGASWALQELCPGGSFCRGEVWYDSKSKAELLSACQTHTQMPFA